MHHACLFAMPTPGEGLFKRRKLHFFHVISTVILATDMCFLTSAGTFLSLNVHFLCAWFHFLVQNGVKVLMRV